MLTNKLTDAAIRKAKHGDKSVKMSDGGGLYLELHPNGSRYWRMKYRYGGAEKRLAFGVYPEVTLAEARKCRDDARKLIANGADPGELRKSAKAADEAKSEVARMEAAGLPGPGTFEHVAREWLTTIHEAKVSAGHAERTRIRLEQDVFPWLGRRPIAAIEAPELLQSLRRVEARGALETTHRIKDSCSQVFRYGIAAGVCQRNPAAELTDALRPVPVRHHAAIVDPKQGGELLRDLMAYTGHPVTRFALALSALLLLRPGELRQLQWTWVDLEGQTLTIPGELMKRKKADKANGPPHVVPLAPQAIAIFRELQPLTGEKLYVFPSLHMGERPMSENTVNVALRRMGYDRETMTAHGFRAMARTMIAERLGVAPEVIEAQLAHAVTDALGRAYNRTQFIEQRREMMAQWANYLDRLRDGAQVIPIETRTA
jgi:integrase